MFQLFLKYQKLFFRKNFKKNTIIILEFYNNTIIIRILLKKVILFLIFLSITYEFVCFFFKSKTNKVKKCTYIVFEYLSTILYNKFLFIYVKNGIILK